jgi:acyl-CoA synthetase (AMP-forming)/AMP-acid ligase II
MERLGLSILEKLKEHSSATAIVCRNIAYTYEELTGKIGYYEKQLTVNNIKNGDTVLLLSDYSFDSIALFLATFKMGLIVVPVTSSNVEETNERISIIGDCWIYDLRKNLVSRRLGERHYAIIDDIRGKENAGLVLFSSGSTGKPKAMVHNLDHLVASYLQKKGKSLVFLVFLMFDHIGGLNTLLNCLVMGACIVIPESRDPEEIAELVERYKINVLPASPTFLNLMLIAGVKNTHDLGSLRMITYGTEPMPESLLLKLKENFPKVKFLQTFGTSETGIIKTVSKSSESTFLKFDDPDQEHKIVNGELWLRSKTQIMGYLNHSMESFTDDGWFKTGDLVEETANDYLKIIGRAKEVINVGGEKVLPAEIESVVLELPFVRDCIAYGVPNIVTGQIVAVNVTLKENIEMAEMKKLIKTHCSSKLDKYKVPVKINVIDKLSVSDRFKKIRLGQHG